MKKGSNATISKQTLNKLDAIRAKVLEDYKPTKSEITQMTAHANEIMARLKRVVPRNVEIIFVGSVARGTQIRGSSDIDIFLLFPKGTSREDLEKKGLEYAKKIVEKKKGERFEIKYAEHPYLKIYFDDMGIKADIVPAYKIRDASERGSSVDRTQLHNEFMMSNLSQKQRDDVVVLKVLLKSHNIYGANAQYSGFSGYLCELMIHTYRSFNNLVKRFAEQAPPVLIDPKRRREITKKEELEIATKRFNSDFVVIDPTDPNRNVAAATSTGSIARFMLICEVLVKKPSLEFFYGPKYDDTYSERKLANSRKALKLNIYALHFKVPDIAEDIIWQQLRRLSSRLEGVLRKNGFAPTLSIESLSGKDAIIGFFIKKSVISNTIVQGPTTEMKDSVKKFIAAHPKSLKIFYENDRVFSLEHSKYKTAKDVLNAQLKDSSEFPSYLKKENAKLYEDKMPEDIAKMVYSASVRKTNL